MESKYASDAVAAFEKILRKNAKPDGVWVEQGTSGGSSGGISDGIAKNLARVKASKSNLQEMK